MASERAEAMVGNRVSYTDEHGRTRDVTILDVRSSGSAFQMANGSTVPGVQFQVQDYEGGDVRWTVTIPDMEPACDIDGVRK